MAGLVAETGAGLSNANSFITIVELNAYATLVGQDGTLTDKTDDEKDVACIVATQYLEALYGPRVKGERAVINQALLFPRLNLLTFDGVLLDADIVPSKWKDATCESALRHFTEAAGLLPDQEADARISEEMVKVGPITESIKYIGGKTALKRFTIINMLVKEYLRSGSEIIRG